MSGFDDSWLALREPADDRARDAALERALTAHLVDRVAGRAVDRASDRTPLRVLDLGSGTGANLRRLAPRLGRDQRWMLVDDDQALLGRVVARLDPWADALGVRREIDGDAPTLYAGTFDATLVTRALDLATGLDALPFGAQHLITASALLDLAGAVWLDALAERCAAAGAAALFALSYDGRLRWTPALDDDAAMHARFDRHQRRDKGLGVALGPDAGAHLATALRGHGLDVRTAPSDWRLGAADGALQRELAAGLAASAAELDPAFAARAEAWLAARRASIDTGRSSLVVGHVDVLALPA